MRLRRGCELVVSGSCSSSPPLHARALGAPPLGTLTAEGGAVEVKLMLAFVYPTVASVAACRWVVGVSLFLHSLSYESSRSVVIDWQPVEVYGPYIMGIGCVVLHNWVVARSRGQ